MNKFYITPWIINVTIRKWSLVVYKTRSLYIFLIFILFILKYNAEPLRIYLYPIFYQNDNVIILISNIVTLKIIFMLYRINVWIHHYSILLQFNRNKCKSNNQKLPLVRNNAINWRYTSIIVSKALSYIRGVIKSPNCLYDSAFESHKMFVQRRISIIIQLCSLHQQAETVYQYLIYMPFYLVC